jgi:hypothetical protein
MKYFTYHLLTMLFVCGMVRAQEPVAIPEAPSKLDAYVESGMEVQGIRAPYYDEEGELRAQLYGGYAKVLEGGVADITNLRIDVYKDNEIEMTIFAPQCFMKMAEIEGLQGKKILSVYSDGDVLFDMEQMTISGKGFTFSSNGNRFEIKSEAKVLVKESINEMEGLDL